MCKRGFGIGADGILYGPILDGDKISVKIFNPMEVKDCCKW